MKKLLGNLSLMVLTFFFCCLLFEAGVRLIAPQNIETPYNYYTSDQDLLFKAKPNLSQSFSSSDFKMNVQINKAGFRGAHREKEKDQGVFRIAGIGDSMLFGWGVDYKDIMLTQIGEFLNQNKPSQFKKIEELNFGIPGYNINYYHKALQMKASQYEPDLVIVFFHPNDWTKTEKTQYIGVNKDGYLVTKRSKFSLRSIRSFLYPLRSYLKSHSQAYMFVRDRMQGFLMKNRLMAITSANLYKKRARFREEYTYTFDMIDRMYSYTTSNLNSEFLLVMIPEKLQAVESLKNIVIDSYNLSEEEYDWNQPQITLLNFCKEKNMHCLDLTNLFLVNNKETDPLYFKIDKHWNEKGHLLAAQEVKNFIIQNKLININPTN